MAKQDKAAKKAAAKEQRRNSPGRVRQIIDAFQMQRREDKLLLPLMIAVFLGVTVVVFLLGMIWDLHWVFLPVGLAFGLLGA
ncbi:DUF4191 family protein, partial [Klebsiella pneumoniae]|nr:DUF4191 family protein [Klebsiella pneumoniae]